MDRKKKLKEMYKSMKPDMGIFIIKSNINNKCYIEATPNLKGSMNRARFQLELGNHFTKGLQEEWKKQGKENFTIEVLEKLEYDKDESKTDYSEELEILKMVWKEKLVRKGMEIID